MPKGKGQAWSLDLVIGVLIFLLAIGTIYSLLNGRQQHDTVPLRIESEVVATVLTSDASGQALQVADKNQLYMDKLGGLAEQSSTDYEELKRQLGVEHEFCIYLQDDEGNLVYIVAPDGRKYAGVGSGSNELNLTGAPCGSTVP